MAILCDTGPMSYALADDTALLDGLRGRDPGALDEAHRRHGAQVAGAVRRVLVRWGEVEDLTQEVFTMLWTHPDTFDPARGSLGGFLATVARRRAIDRIRAESSRCARESRHGRRASPAGGDGVADAVETRAIGVEVRAALDRLPAGEQAAIRLAYFAGLSYREVAAHLGEPEGTVKSRIRAGLGRLRVTTGLAALQLAV